MRANRKMWFVLGCLVVPLLMSSCATTNVETITMVSGLTEPDLLIIHDLTVKADIELDRNLRQRIGSNSAAARHSEEEIAVGEAVAAELTKALIKKLNEAGIYAVPAGPAVTATDRTLSFKGAFITVDEGSRAARIFVGFGLGRTEVRTMGIVVQGTPPSERVIGEFRTVAKSAMTPGTVPMGAVGSVGASAARTVVSEKLLLAVEKDANRTAKKIAKDIERHYKQQGWL